MKKILKYIFVGLLGVFMMTACEREEVPLVTSVSIDSLSIVPAYEEVSIVCRFNSTMTIEHATLYLSRYPDFSEKEKIALQAKSLVLYSTTIKQLLDGITYYIKIEIHNHWSTMLMDETLEFRTMPLSTPTMSSTEVAERTFNSAIVEGDIVNDGGRTISSAGIVYSTEANPTIDNAIKIESEVRSGKLSLFIGHLQEDQVYYARTYAVNEIGVAYGDEVSFAVDTLWKGRDLGLSVNWGHVNVGAFYPEEAGDYFAWGEIAPKEEYNWLTYLHCNQDPQQITKYAPYVDGLSSLEPADDAATMNWGDNWRMPTEKEWDELREQCDWKWVVINNVKGYKVTSKNGASIFLPAAGKIDGRNLLNKNEKGLYWTKWLTTAKHDAKIVEMDAYNYDRAYETRCYGLSVRPVCSK